MTRKAYAYASPIKQLIVSANKVAAALFSTRAEYTTGVKSHEQASDLQNTQSTTSQRGEYAQYILHREHSEPIVENVRYIRNKLYTA